MKHRIFCNWNCSLIVYKYLCAFLLLHLQISYQFSNLNSLIHDSSSSNILCLCCGLSYDFLLLWTPRKNSRTKAKTITWSAPHVINTAGPINVKITMEYGVFNLTKLQSIVNCSLNVSDNSFCCLKMNFTCTMHIPWKYTCSIHNVGSCCSKIHQASY